MLFSCLAYRAGVRHAFRLVLILLASLFSEGFITWASNPLHVTLRCPVDEVRTGLLPDDKVSRSMLMEGGVDNPKTGRFATNLSL